MPLIENVLTSLWRLLGTSTGHDALMWAAETQLYDDPRAMYRLRRMLYENNRAFRDTESDELTLGLRNPTAACVNFHALTTWPGALPDALPIETSFTKDKAEPLIDAIHQVWQWSDWQINKQVYARLKARDGDSLIQVVTRGYKNRDGKYIADSVYFHMIDVEYLSEFDVDDRGLLTWLRLDIPKRRRNTRGELVPYIHTEVWDKASGNQTIWEHDKGVDAELKALGEPLSQTTIESQTGTDMLPFVHGKHLHMGHKRGAAAIDHALVKVHEASRMATRLHSMGFQYGEPDMQLVGIARDPDGRPTAPPKLGNDNGTVVKIGRKNLYRIPGGWHLEGVPLDVAFEALRLILSDHMQHIQEGDLPQLAYYKLASSSRDLSGEALGHMLKPAVELALEVRGNSESELVRANQMACTIGKHHKLPLFLKLGDYDKGDLDHRFAQREIIPMTSTERAEVEERRSTTAINRQSYGWSNRALLKEDGLTDDEITVMATERVATAAERGARLLRAGDAGDVDREE